MTDKQPSKYPTPKYAADHALQAEPITDKQPSERAMAAAEAFMLGAWFVTATDLDDSEPEHVIMQDHEFAAFLDQYFRAYDELLAACKKALASVKHQNLALWPWAIPMKAAVALAEPEQPK